jgi:light-regulated signal transduction histidine kinase (bacteriophytochrome)
MNILLILKDPDVIRKVKDFLLGILDKDSRILHSNSVSSAFEMLSSMKIDVVLIDLSTPVKSDSDILLKIKDQFPLMPFVALTSFDDVEFDISDCGIEVSTFLYKHKLNGKILLKSLSGAIAHQKIISQLEVHRIELERSNRDLEKFSYAVSHDLREPLRSISGFIQLLSKRYRGSLDANADHYIERLNSAASRMQDMITSILDYSKISTNTEPFKLVDCNEILKNALDNIEIAISESGAKITYAPMPSIYADPIQIQRVFQNLIANSIKFSSKDKNTPVIHVGVDKKDDFYEFYVKDNGIGIDSKYFERIFIIFQRLHNDAVYPGHGVGLAICKKIVERHGGTMRIVSVPGKGSTFYFSISAKGKESINVN